MGFEDNKDALGFEADQLDLDNDTDLSMGNGSVRAQRKKGIKTEEVAFARPKRDRFGRRGDGEEMGEGADMLNPDKPTRIAGGFARREMTPHEVKPLQSENSKFSYLFSEDEEDEDEVSTVEGKRSAVDALAMKGDEADAGNIFERETRSVIHSQGKPQRRQEELQESARPAAGAGRFSRRSEAREQPEQAEKPATSRFARRSTVQEAPAEPVREEPKPEAIQQPTEEPAAQEPAYTEPAAEEIPAEPAAEAAPESAVYADSQAYGYGNPYMYGNPYQPYGQPYPPYGGYPQQPPYGQGYGNPYQPYGQPYQPYGAYPPAAYNQPQYIPVGYVFQAGFVPVELAHNTPQRRKRRPSAARSAYRYDQLPEAECEEAQPQREPQRVRAIAAARSEAEPVQEVYTEPVQETPQTVAEPAPVVKEEPVVEEKPAVYETQYERIAAEIPAQPVITEEKEEKTESAVPSRFARRGASQTAQTESPVAERAVPSRFASRGSASRSTSFEDSSSADIPSAPQQPSGGRFNRRG